MEVANGFHLATGHCNTSPSASRSAEEDASLFCVADDEEDQIRESHARCDGPNHIYLQGNSFKSPPPVQVAGQTDAQDSSISYKSGESQPKHGSQFVEVVQETGQEINISQRLSPMQVNDDSNSNQETVVVVAACGDHHHDKIEASLVEDNDRDCTSNNSNSDDDAFIDLCADAVLNDSDPTRRYYINKLYQPMEQDDELLLYEELQYLDSSAAQDISTTAEEREQMRLTKILEEEDEDYHQVVSGNQRRRDGVDCIDKDPLALTTIIESFDSPFPSSQPDLIDSNHHQQQQQHPYQYHRAHLSSSNDLILHQESPHAKPDSTRQDDTFVTTSGGSSCDSALYESNNSNNNMQTTFNVQTFNQHQNVSLGSVCDANKPLTGQNQVGQTIYGRNSVELEDDKQAASSNCAKSSSSGRKKSVQMNKYRRRTANARERIRMREINQAFERLKKVVPVEMIHQVVGCSGDESDQSSATTASTSRIGVRGNKSSPSSQQPVKLTKITTLKLAVNYIAKLSEILNQHPHDGQASDSIRTISSSASAATDSSNRGSRSKVKKSTNSSSAGSKGNRRRDRKRKARSGDEEETKIQVKSGSQDAVKPETNCSNDQSNSNLVTTDTSSSTNRIQYIQSRDLQQIRPQQQVLITSNGHILQQHQQQPQQQQQQQIQDPQQTSGLFAQFQHQPFNTQQQQPQQFSFTNQQPVMISQGTTATANSNNCHHQERAFVTPVAVAILGIPTTAGGYPAAVSNASAQPQPITLTMNDLNGLSVLRYNYAAIQPLNTRILQQFPTTATTTMSQPQQNQFAITQNGNTSIPLVSSRSQLMPQSCNGNDLGVTQTNLIYVSSTSANQHNQFNSPAAASAATISVNANLTAPQPAANGKQQVQVISNVEQQNQRIISGRCDHNSRLDADCGQQQQQQKPQQIANQTVEQMKFLTTQNNPQQQQQQPQNQQVPIKSLDSSEANIRQLVVSLATSIHQPDNTGSGSETNQDSNQSGCEPKHPNQKPALQVQQQQQQSQPIQQKYHHHHPQQQPHQQQQQQQTNNQQQIQQPKRTYRFHNYDSNMITNHLYHNHEKQQQQQQQLASSAVKRNESNQKQQQQQQVAVVSSGDAATASPPASAATDAMQTNSNHHQSNHQMRSRQNSLSSTCSAASSSSSSATSWSGSQCNKV